MTYLLACDATCHGNSRAIGFPGRDVATRRRSSRWAVPTVTYLNIACRVLNAQDDAGQPLNPSQLADILEGAVRAEGWRLAALSDLPTEAHARRGDPSESHDAAASVNLNGKHESIRVVLRAWGPLTDEQIAEQYPQDVAPTQTLSSLRSRRAELVAAGLVRATGETRPTRSGRQAQVWECVT